MKRIILFLMGFILLALTGIAIYFTGGIFDAAKNQNVYPYFFQPNNLSSQRPGVPQTPEYIGEKQFMDMMVKKYITEYFYAAPDNENIARRTRPDSALARMSSSDVFDEWLSNESENIQKLANEKSMRTAYVIDKIFQPTGSKYWVVNYELVTWQKPNDFNTIPIISRGTMYMDITYDLGIRKNVDIDIIHDYLEQGGDPAAVFNFRVNKIIQG